MDRRAVSEIVGFVLIFSVITISVGAVYVVGFSGLQETRDAERIANAERAFDVLADNVDDIHHGDAPYRATEFKLYDASLKLGRPTRLTVELMNVNGPDTPNPTYSVQTYPLVYEPQGSATRIRYVDGAVFREDRGGATMLNQPPVVFRRDTSGVRTAVIPMIETRSTDPEFASGTTTVLVRANLAISEVMAERTDPTDEANTNVDGTDAANEYEVRFAIETSPVRAPLWESYLEKRIGSAYPNVDDPCSLPGDGTVECTFPVERLYVTATRIDVSIES